MPPARIFAAAPRMDCMGLNSMSSCFGCDHPPFTADLANCADAERESFEPSRQLHHLPHFQVSGARGKAGHARAPRTQRRRGEGTERQAWAPALGLRWAYAERAATPIRVPATAAARQELRLSETQIIASSLAAGDVGRP
jgi:hypothetical protein